MVIIDVYFLETKHMVILRFVEEWFPLMVITAETKVEFRKAAADLGTHISISPKMANQTKNRPARCQCAISNGLFNHLII